MTEIHLLYGSYSRRSSGGTAWLLGKAMGILGNYCKCKHGNRPKLLAPKGEPQKQDRHVEKDPIKEECNEIQTILISLLANLCCLRLHATNNTNFFLSATRLDFLHGKE